MRLFVSIARILLGIAVITANGGAAIAADPVASPVPAGTCAIEPRSPEEIMGLAGTIAEGETIPERNGGQFHDSIPTGAQVDEATVAVVTTLLADVVACVNMGDAPQLYTFYSDHFIYAQGPINSETLASISDPPVPNAPDEWLWIDLIHSIEVLPDARIAAIVTIGGINEIDPYPGKAFVFVLAMTRVGWRIDDQFDEFLAPDGTGLISVEEYLAG